jgi:hypothetical protein
MLCEKRPQVDYQILDHLEDGQRFDHEVVSGGRHGPVERVKQISAGTPTVVGSTTPSRRRAT